MSSCCVFMLCCVVTVLVLESFWLSVLRLVWLQKEFLYDMLSRCVFAFMSNRLTSGLSFAFFLLIASMDFKYGRTLREVRGVILLSTVTTLRSRRVGLYRLTMDSQVPAGAFETPSRQNTKTLAMLKQLAPNYSRFSRILFPLNASVTFHKLAKYVSLLNDIRCECNVILGLFDFICTTSKGDF